jgi:glycosyltransferase involved in cell wall biosynthesis
MPTLLSINNYFYRRGGAEVVFLEQNRLLSGIGWQVIPFAMKHSHNNKSQWSEYFVDEIEFGNKYSFSQKIRNAFKITYSYESKKKIGHLIEKTNPDIAHAHNIYHHISPSIFAELKLRGIPTVLTLHDLKIACPAYKMLTHDGICERCKSGNLYNVVKHKCIKNSTLLSSVILIESSVQKLLGSYSKNVDKFIVPSRFYMNKFIEWGWPKEKFIYIPNFVDHKLLTPSESKPGKHFVYFGRLSTEKGIETLIRATAKANVSLKVVGTGPLENELQNLISELGADIELLGYQTGDKLFRIIQSGRAVILPSEWYENAPISIMESYALERPVIGADIGGIPEMVRIGETGHLFQSGNINELSKLLIEYSSFSDEIILKMGKIGRTWVLEDFTVDKYLNRLDNLYKEMGVTS